MRIDVRKVLFVGTSVVLQTFLEEAQRKGIIEFIDEKKKGGSEVPPQIQKLLAGIKVLRGLPVAEQLEGVDLAQALPVAEAVLTLHHDLENLHEERRVLRQEIARVAPFGRFSPSTVATLQKEGNRRIQFFVAKSHAEVEAVNRPEVVYITSDHGMDYYVAVNKEPQQYSGMIEMIIDEPLQILERKMRLVEEKITAKEDNLKSYGNRKHLLHEALVDEMNHHDLEAARGASNDPMEGIFAVHGWVPEDKLNELHAIVREHDVHFEEVAIEKEDRVPTYLENTGFAKIGEDLIQVYDTPSTKDKDPSAWVLWSFAVFFAIIVGDGGYGLIILAIAAYLRYQYGAMEGIARRLITLAFILGTGCVIWGALTHSFFGIKFDLDSSWRKNAPIERMVEAKATYHLSRRDATYEHWVKEFPQLTAARTPKEFLRAASVEKNGSRRYVMADKFFDNLMLEMALLIGVIHVILGFLRNIRENWAGLGWIAAMIGGVLLAPGYLQATSILNFTLGIDRAWGYDAGMQLLAGGLGAAVLFSVIQNRLSGLAEPLNVVQVFGDVLSYVRLYALGLAGATLSGTFNDMGAGLGLVAGALVILAGHTVNIVLCLMGGVIHGLRLNFLEWYHYCFDGGGKLFKPLIMKKVR